MDTQVQMSPARYSPEQKQQIIEQWKQSGLSRRAFCLQQKFCYYTLIHWTKEKRIRKKVVASDFIPVDVKKDTEQVFAQIEIQGKRIQLFQPVTAHFLKHLIG